MAKGRPAQPVQDSAKAQTQTVHSLTTDNASSEHDHVSLMTRDEIEAMIADGRKLIIFHHQVLKIDAWLPYHPGGQKALLHMVGKDATDAIEAMHSPEAQQQMLRYRIGRIGKGTWTNFTAPIQGGIFRSLAEIQGAQENGLFECSSLGFSSASNSESSSTSSSQTLPTSINTDDDCFRQRQDETKSASFEPLADEPLDGMSYLDSITHEFISLDLEKYPAVDVDTQAHIVTKFRELRQKVTDAGLFESHLSDYAPDCCRYVFLFAMMLLCVRYGYYGIGGIFMGLTWHQLVFTAHDAGHTGVTGDWTTDTMIGIIIADFIGGLSMGWWKDSHNVHHIVTNQPEHDPDIEHMPIFAISHRLLGNLRSTYYDRMMEYDAVAKLLLRIQAWTYYPFLSLGRFNLYVLSWKYVLLGLGPRKGAAAWHRWAELAGQIFFWIWYGYGIVYTMIPDGWSRFAFIMTSHMAASPLHLQIVLSHFAMSTADLGPQESFAQRALRTTMDVDCPPWLDFVHGGLQYQAIHHLFPRMPRHNLRKAQVYVQEFCQEVGIPYALYGFARGNKRVLSKLAEVSRQAAILSKCKQTMIEKGELFSHHH